MRSFFDYDAKLAGLKDSHGSHHHFKRFKSLSELPFDFTSCYADLDNGLIEHYRAMITRVLISKFALPTLTRSDMGSLVNVDEALEGIPECYRHVRPVKSVLKLGLNVSGYAYTTQDIFAMRCAAILAVRQLAMSRGQKVQFDTCYGYFGAGRETGSKIGHSRITMLTPTVELIKTVMSEDFRSAMCRHVGKPFAGFYQLWHLENHPMLKGQPREFDFVLDRLETDNKEVEYARILKQIERLK